MTFTSPKTGEPVLRAYQIPRRRTPICEARRLFSEKWAEATFGLMGRSPDHVAGFFTGYAAVPGVFAAGGQKFADNVVAFYETHARRASLPQLRDRSAADRPQQAGAQAERSDAACRRGEGARRRHRDHGRAAGRDRRRAVRLDPPELHPSAAARRRELRQLRRRPGQRAGREAVFRAGRSRCAPTNSFDYPLSSRFDESDSYVVFDNVFVPWEHVFIYRNLEITRDQWWKTPSHAYGNHQAQVRYVTKLRFMMGLAQRTIEMIGSAGNPPVQIAMGEIAALASIYEGMLLAHETNAPIEDGVLWPSMTTLYAAMAMQSEFNGRMLEMVRELVSSSVISLPSSVADFDNPEIAPIIERYMRSGSMDARSRTALVRMLWDFLGTEFGSRHQQYEKFYGGSSFLVKQNVYRNYDFKRATALVDAALALPPVKGELTQNWMPSRALTR